MKNILSIIVFLVLTTTLTAQKKIPVTARGSYEARDLTLEEVKAKAIDEAKKNAMVKAGISENVKVSDFLYTFEDDEKFKEIFQSFVSTETGADIIVEDVKETNRDINEFGNILIEVEIHAVIFKHKSEKDLSFQFKVEGIKEFYYDTAPLNFSFKPAKEGYLRIFNVTDKTAFILYPYSDPSNNYLNDEQGRLFAKNQRVHFPVNTNMDGYYFEIDNKEKDKEYNLLIFVYTKADIPFMEDVKVENIMKWIYELPLDERAVEQYGIVVRR
ncbi:MAG: hypothetical protein K8R68_01545 [Bacteroidales bacterium]|nr:hypothetical protein [Bacteroidales bacterium]